MVCFYFADITKMLWESYSRHNYDVCSRQIGAVYEWSANVLLHPSFTGFS
jgi:hypothetical protein